MKRKNGTIFISFSLILTAILWWFSTPSEQLLLLDKVSHTIAGVALVGLAWVLLLSTRNTKVTNLFSSLESIYKIHKYLAIASVILVFIHARISESVEASLAVGEVVKSTSALLGTIGQFAFILLTLFALFGKKVKYEKWRFFHRLMIIPYILGAYHTYLSSKYDLFAMTPLAIWVGLTTLVGLVSGIYTIFFYQKKGFKYEGLVSQITYLNKDTLEIEMTFDQTVPYRNGQYIFLKVFQKGIEKAPHPYSIARSGKNKLYIAIKKLGDGTTDLYDKLIVGTKVKVDAPYGHLNFDKGGDKQIWIAGGIGITPFISYVNSGNLNKDIDLYYTYRGKDEATYKDILEKAQHENKRFKVHFNDTSENERLNIASIEMSDNSTVFICGPKKMAEYFIKVTKSNQPKVDLNYEAFGF
jgi:predicted ferric reductase